MFSRKKKAERTAAQAWDYLSSAMAAAAESAREAGKYTAEVASSRASDLSDAAGRAGSKLAGAAGRTSGKAGKKAGKKSRKAADRTAARVSAVGNEAWIRANAAADALTGRRPGRPWGLITGVGLLGVALGWAAASSARAALERQAENEQLELAETAVIVTPSTHGGASQ